MRMPYRENWPHFACNPILRTEVEENLGEPKTLDGVKKIPYCIHYFNGLPPPPAGCEKVRPSLV